MLSLFWNLIPPGYKWSVAIKKVSYTMAKVGFGLLAGSEIGKHIDPAHLHVAEEVSAAVVAGGLTYLHDLAHTHWPNVKWL